MQRYGATTFSAIRQPRPGDRESRFPVPRDRSFHRPNKEAANRV